MDKKELQIIVELMDQLQDEMSLNKDDLSKRLGREEPKVEVLKIESDDSMDNPELEEAEESLGMDLDNDNEEGKPLDHQERVLGGESNPDEELKRRLMKIRG